MVIATLDMQGNIIEEKSVQSHEDRTLEDLSCEFIRRAWPSIKKTAGIKDKHEDECAC
jgi:outer membrane biosynthesis protein TonB